MFKGKMKRFISVIGVLVLMLSLVACGDKRTAQEKEAAEAILENAVRVDVQYGITLGDISTVKKVCSGAFFSNPQIFRLTVAENGGQKQGDFGIDEFNKVKDIIKSLKPVANEKFADDEEVARQPEDHGFITVYYTVEGQEEVSKSYFRVSDTKKLNEDLDELIAQCN